MIRDIFLSVSCKMYDENLLRKYINDRARQKPESVMSNNAYRPNYNTRIVNTDIPKSLYLGISYKMYGENLLRKYINGGQDRNLNTFRRKEC